MHKIYFVILALVGAAMIYLGIDGIPSVGPALHRFFTSAPTEVATWLLLLGVLVALTGVFGAWWDQTRFN
jgi:hypothetical protein